VKTADPVAGLIIRPYRYQDEPQLLELLSISLGGGPAGKWSPRFLRWKHFENPFGSSLMLVAELEGRIVGLRAFLRWRFQAGQRTLTAVRAVDTSTHPEYQRRGIFSRLTKEALHSLRGQADLVFNTPNDKSLPGYLKMGWRVVGRVPLAVRIRRPARVFRGLWANESTAPRSVDPPGLDMPTAADVIGRRDSLVPLLSSLTLPSDRWQTPRDVEFLRWRYGPGTSLDYRAVQEEDARGLRGLGVFRIRPRRGLWETIVDELIVRPGDRAAARRILQRIVRAAPVDYVVCCPLPGGVLSSAARRTGFIRSPESIPLVANPLREVPAPEPLALSAWALTLGDLEVF
jgi:GNAT superfamily N-acetyltransferase